MSSRNTADWKADSVGFVCLYSLVWVPKFSIHQGTFTVVFAEQSSGRGFFSGPEPPTEDDALIRSLPTWILP